MGCIKCIIGTLTNIKHHIVKADHSNKIRILIKQLLCGCKHRRRCCTDICRNGLRFCRLRRCILFIQHGQYFLRFALFLHSLLMLPMPQQDAADDDCKNNTAYCLRNQHQLLASALSCAHAFLLPIHFCFLGYSCPLFMAVIMLPVPYIYRQHFQRKSWKSLKFYSPVEIAAQRVCLWSRLCFFELYALETDSSMSLPHCTLNRSTSLFQDSGAPISSVVPARAGRICPSGKRISPRQSAGSVVLTNRPSGLRSH